MFSCWAQLPQVATSRGTLVAAFGVYSSHATELVLIVVPFGTAPYFSIDMVLSSGARSIGGQSTVYLSALSTSP
jgi:hypothetical protein